MMDSNKAHNEREVADVGETKTLNGVVVQENGIIRNREGRIIGRLVDKVWFDSEYIVDDTLPRTNHD